MQSQNNENSSEFRFRSDTKSVPTKQPFIYHHIYISHRQRCSELTSAQKQRAVWDARRRDQSRAMWRPRNIKPIAICNLAR